MSALRRLCWAIAERRERFERTEGSIAARWASDFASARFERAEAVARFFRAAKRAARSLLVPGVDDVAEASAVVSIARDCEFDRGVGSSASCEASVCCGCVLGGPLLVDFASLSSADDDILLFFVGGAIASDRRKVLEIVCICCKIGMCSLFAIEHIRGTKQSRVDLQ